MIYDRVLIFGGTGSLGTTLIKQWNNMVNKFYVYSRDEYKQWLLCQTNPQVNFILGDINDIVKVEETIMRINPTLIIIASAMKHIDKCQQNVRECLNTNVNGILNVIDVIKKMYHTGKSIKTEKIIFVSTDKA